jgi:hypothetical protein
MPKAKKQCMVLFFSRTFFGVHFMACWYHSCNWVLYFL